MTKLWYFFEYLSIYRLYRVFYNTFVNIEAAASASIIFAMCLLVMQI